MKGPFLVVLSILMLTASLQAETPVAPFRPIFDGESLNGWQGTDEFWQFDNGAITRKERPETTPDQSSDLIWKNGTVDDFELRFQVRTTGSLKAAAGVLFRSEPTESGDAAGLLLTFPRDGQPGKLQTVGGQRVLAQFDQKSIKQSGEWNLYLIRASGNNFTITVNGTVVADVTDQDAKSLSRSGQLAFRFPASRSAQVAVKEISLKRLPLQNGWKKVVFIAGKPSHAYSHHEHNAGCLLLNKQLQQAAKEGLPVVTAVYTNGWPNDVTALDNADTVVAYCDGGANHFLNPNIEEFNELVEKKGIGLVCLHYGVETTAGKNGDHFLKWIGGFFEPHWSVNPHWVANYESIPKHPVTQGVKPFEINDEWYYHMRFVPEMAGVTPVLTALPPRETLTRKDGPHSGNPHVRAAVLERNEPQHTAWVYERPNGKGRGFGFTGGHYHANWQHDDFRKLVLNAIVWTAGGTVPEQGVQSRTPTVEEMEANHDGKRPDGFQFQSPIKPKTPVATSGAAVKPAYQSPVVSAATPGMGVDIAVDIKGAKSLYLVISGTSDGYSCDWANWEEPRLVGEALGAEQRLTDLKWVSATTDFGAVQINKNVQGQPLRSNGRELRWGIGSHANSIIEYILPANHQFTQFKARGVLDDGGVTQGCGSTVQFSVFTEKPSQAFLSSLRSTGAAASHEAALALEQLDIHPELKATLFAFEPMMSNPSAIDIDHLGRVWVCEGKNYRVFQNKDLTGENPPGERLLILHDKDNNGVADHADVFYQGRDIDSAHGIMVQPTANGKGTRALISAGDSVFFLIDDDGDLKADRKEVLFSGIAGAFHDHGIHGVQFGPDGRLYFNFGNEGKYIKDKHGNAIVDQAGNVVDHSRKPYQEGMVFRCNLDGSEFQTLGWNFRNNWEVCVDSFGTIWQSDNDDDGNRAVRINYVMEYGNYGYRDEFTGAGWKTPRANLEAAIPDQHWHQNDPGVIPNLVITGAGAPTGICVYEGNLLPQSLRGAIIHTDAGANTCRAYVPKVDGAGYKAEVVNLMEGTRNRWFRPSDVCVAPDGSLMVADWYDAGVGGHRMQDVEHGRIFRLAPTNTSKYVAPQVDVSNPVGATLALQSPNMATRYLAWTALQNFAPAESAEALKSLFKSEDPIMKVRAFWALGNLKLDHAALVSLLNEGLSHSNPDIRIAALRLLRQHKSSVSYSDIQGSIKADDLSPAVRREMLIALREIPSSWYPVDAKKDFLAKSWTHLAKQYDGKDRWYLEALGIAADHRWDEILPVWMNEAGEDWKLLKAGRDIIWRSRSTETPNLLVQLINSPVTPDNEIPALFRALDFQQNDTRNAALLQLAFSPDHGNPERSQRVQIDALIQLGSIDTSKDPKQRAVITAVLKATEGTDRFVKLVNQLNLSDRYPDVLTLAQSQPESQLAVDAIKVLFDKNQLDLLKAAMSGEDRERAERTMTALATSADKRATPLLLAILNDQSRAPWARQTAVNALGSNVAGAKILLEIAQKQPLPDALKSTFAARLTNSPDNAIRTEALKLFPAPPGHNDKPLPPIAELSRRTGDVQRGRVVFNTTGSCNKCHQVNGIGIEVGPNLSEIGKKLAKPALYESILFPSAAISHGYENWLIATDDGQIYTGLLVSETDQEVKIKNDKGLIHTIPIDQIEARKKQDVSLMPADLQRLMTTDELVDLVEYMTTLKERRL